MAIGDGFERRLEVGMRVDPVHFRRFDQTSDAGPGRRTLVVADRDIDANSAFLRFSASGRIVFSTTFESISTRPSVRNTCSPSQ